MGTPYAKAGASFVNVDYHVHVSLSIVKHRRCQPLPAQHAINLNQVSHPQAADARHPIGIDGRPVYIGANFAATHRDMVGPPHYRARCYSAAECTERCTSAPALPWIGPLLRGTALAPAQAGNPPPRCCYQQGGFLLSPLSSLVVQAGARLLAAVGCSPIYFSRLSPLLCGAHRHSADTQHQYPRAEIQPNPLPCSSLICTAAARRPTPTPTKAAAAGRRGGRRASTPGSP